MPRMPCCWLFCVADDRCDTEDIFINMLGGYVNIGVDRHVVVISNS